MIELTLQYWIEQDQVRMAKTQERLQQPVPEAEIAILCFLERELDLPKDVSAPPHNAQESTVSVAVRIEVSGQAPLACLIQAAADQPGNKALTAARNLEARLVDLANIL
ncbi:MAG: hypothetical protein AAFX93_18730 [Verrucomicrobiota bacterium]